jgi:hypothetical protein
MTTQKGTPAGSRLRKHRGGAGRRSCPPHGPIMVDAYEEGYYVASCLACGQTGPERQDGWEAKLAFDEAHQLPPE